MVHLKQAISFFRLNPKMDCHWIEKWMCKGNPLFENVKNASSDKTSFKKETSYLPTFRYSFNFQPVRPFTISLSPL